MENTGFSVEEIRQLIEAAARGGLTRLKVENQHCKVEIEAGAPAATPHANMNYAALAQPEAPAPNVEKEDACVVKAPIVGTFYAAPAPEDPPFVQVGSTVKKGDVLFIVESMKLLNEILCEKDGTVTAILVENAQPLEYGQPVMRIE